MQLCLKSIAVLSALAAAALMPVSVASPVLADVSMDSSDIPDESASGEESSGVTLAENDEGEGVELAPNETETQCDSESASASRC